MSILANINPLGVAETDRFIQIFNTNSQYATNLVSAFGNGNNADERDHFIGMFNDIDNITNVYASNPNDATNLGNVINDIQRNKKLRSWVSAVFCAFIYGYDNDNKIDIYNVPFKVSDGINFVPVPDTKFLDIWRKKFNQRTGGGGNDNVYNFFPNDAVKTANINNNGLNFVTFVSGSSDYPDLLGCFSQKYFVIPLKEMFLRGQPISAWKNTYQTLISKGDRFITDIDKILNIRQKTLLALSAASIMASPNAASSLKLIASIINSKIDISCVNLTGVTLSPMKAINDVNFYKINDIIDIDNLISGELNIMYIKNDNGFGEFYATYPFTNAMIKSLESNKCSIEGLSLNIKSGTSHTGMTVEEATISLVYKSTFMFASPVEGASDIPITFSLPIEKKYTPDKINNIRAMPTICMYPNFAVNYENNCNKYTYFSCSEVGIMSENITNLNPIDLSNGKFKVSLNRGEGKSVIFAGTGAYAQSTIIDTNNLRLLTHTASAVDHFIELSDQNGMGNFGCIMNMRNTGATDDVPALMSANVSADISFAPPTIPSSPSKMSAYIDFGSSSSYMAYKIGTAPSLMPDIINNDCTMRMLLVRHDKTGIYKKLVNDPRILKKNQKQFPSASALYDKNRGITDMYIYKDAWMPITNTFSEFSSSGITINPSMKTSLVSNAGEISPQIIINNLCYIIACNAVSMNCNVVEIVPSLPSSDYFNNLQTIWADAIRNINSVFPNLEINNIITLNPVELLYESVAISNGISQKSPNTLQINIDIGDGTTDMSAMITTAGGVTEMCGYSSVNYAGKDLIKTVISDILSTASADTATNLMKGMYSDKQYAKNFREPLLKPNTSALTDEYLGKINSLIENFFAGSVKKNPPESSWENNVVDILAISRLHNDIDQKVAANIILRYMILMPVIRDFILTSIKIAGDKVRKGQTTINIDFYGGGAKGITLMGIVDKRSVNSKAILESYFAKELSGYSVNIDVPPDTKGIDSKETLIKGLTTIVPIANNGRFVHAGGAGNVAKINWGSINPKNSSLFGEPDNPHCGTGNFNFVSLSQCDDNPVEAESENNMKIQDAESYYQDTSNTFDELNNYFNNEIYDKLIDNHDGVADVIEMLIKKFTSKASPKMKSFSHRELINGHPGNSFFVATNSNIYPEMIKDTIFMFVISKLLSEFHNGYKSDGLIQALGDVTSHEFGG